jgi:glutaryl-CoA dehydrogenase
MSRDPCYDKVREIYKKFGQQGFIGCSLDWRGNEAVSNTAFALICKEVERVDSSFRSMLSVQNSLVTWPIYAYGSDAAKEKYLDGLMSCELIGCFGLTEPSNGSDPGNMHTKAVPKVIN